MGKPELEQKQEVEVTKHSVSHREVERTYQFKADKDSLIPTFADYVGYVFLAVIIWLIYMIGMNVWIALEDHGFDPIKFTTNVFSGSGEVVGDSNRRVDSERAIDFGNEQRNTAARKYRKANSAISGLAESFGRVLNNSVPEKKGNIDRF